MDLLTGFPARIANSGLDAETEFSLNVAWPLGLLPLLLIVQLFAPSPIWIGLVCAWFSVYCFSFFWLRLQVMHLDLQREVINQVLLVGDELEVESRVENSSFVPVLWCKVAEQVPVHQRISAARVIACGSRSFVNWTENYICQRRGRLQLGPAELLLGDPVGLFQVSRMFTESTRILVHPRIINLPETSVPMRSLRGNLQRRRRLRAEAKAPTIRQYQTSDSHHLIHWPSTARLGELMVAELESEPGTRLTVILNLYGPDHCGEGSASTLEFAISVAGSLVAQSVKANDQRQCGLLCAESETKVSTLVPGQGSGHMWSGLRLLADVNVGDFPLHRLLARSHLLARSQQEDSLLVVTSYPSPSAESDKAANLLEIKEQQNIKWLAELHSLQQRGIGCGVLLIRHPSQRKFPLSPKVFSLLSSFPQTVLETDASYTPLITHRRQRKEYLSTPFGGVMEVNVVEEIG